MGLGSWVLLLPYFCLQVQAVITARNMALPYIFWMAEWLERFHPRTALKMKLVRLFLLYLSSLYVLIIALFTLSTQCVSAQSSVSQSVCLSEPFILYILWISALNLETLAQDAQDSHFSGKINYPGEGRGGGGELSP